LANTRKLIIGIGGASGVIYGIRLLEILRGIADIETHLVMSKTARMNIAVETNMSAADVEALADQIHSVSQVGANIASGSFKTHGMIVAACSMKNLSAIVHSHADDLLTRAADVALKERRPLVLMPRETPLHAGHCKLMLEASNLGAIVAPPMPAMYTRPTSIDDIVNHSVGRVLDLLNIDTGLVDRWQGPTSGKSDA
jgi:4-hydroxy-3-polyprenylbenzoate decarboxylase